MTASAREKVLSLPRSGRTLRLRGLTPDDLPALKQAFDSADPTVLRARFGGAAPKLGTLARRVRALDGHASHAVAVFSDDGQVVGVAEYQLTGVGSAEVAVIVATAWQREGVATALLQELGTHAMREGITTATALLSGSNHDVLDLVHDIPMSHSIHYDHGAGELCVDLTADAAKVAATPPGKE